MNSIRTRILFFFTLFGLASALGVFLTSWSSNDIGSAAEKIVYEHLPMVHALGQMEVALNRQNNAVYRYVTAGDRVWLDNFEKERQGYLKWFAEALDRSQDAIEEGKLNEIEQLYVDYDNSVRQVLLLAGSKRDTRQMLRDESEQLEKIQGLIDQVVLLRQGMTIVLKDSIHSVINRNKLFAFSFPVLIMGFFGFLAVYLYRTLVRPLTLLIGGIRNFTHGQTEIRIPNIGKDELGELQEAFNEMSREINSERKKLKTESQSDALTGLFNMRYFRRQLVDEFTRSQRYAHPVTLLMADVDFFKNYNDRNGHPAGDIVLKEIARILIRNVRGTDIVARYGGEEFVILLPETPLDAATHVAEKIRKTIENHHFPFKETQAGGKITISIGVGAYPDISVTSGQGLIEAADKGLYSAKKNGRNRIYVCLKGDALPSESIQSPGIQPTGKK